MTKYLVLLLLLLGLATSAAADDLPAWAKAVRAPEAPPLAAPEFDAIEAGLNRNGTTSIFVRLVHPDHPNRAFADESTLGPEETANQRQTLLQAQDRLLSRLSKGAAATARKFHFIPYMVVNVNPDEFKEILAAPEVDRIEENSVRRRNLDDSVPLIGASRDPALGFDFNGFTGKGQTVAIIDDGIDDQHFAFSGRVVDEYCVTWTGMTNEGPMTEICSSRPPGHPAAPCTAACYHGTHVAGIAAGDRALHLGIPFSGVAREANIIAVNVFSMTDPGAPCPCNSTVDFAEIAALEWVYDQRTKYAIAAVNMSLGHGGYGGYCDGNARYTAAFTALRNAGIATVVASGNSGYINGIGSPACISSAVSVGNTKKDDTVSSDSNSASFLNLLAPGTDIYSAKPGNGYFSRSGTSMAAPHVAGAWAVLKSAKPTASVNEVLNQLVATGVPVTDSRNGITKPRIQVDRAVNGLIYPTPASYSLTVTKGGSGTGSVVSTKPAGISCGAACSMTVPEGQQVVLTATPDSGSAFIGWDGDLCTGAVNPCITPRLPGNVSVRALFGKATGFIDNEGFLTDILPFGWTVVNSVAGGPAWEININGNANDTGGDGNFATVYPFNPANVKIFDTELRSPLYDLSAYAGAVLSFKHHFPYWNSSKFTVDESLDGGTTWTTIWTATGNQPFTSSGLVTVDLPMAGGNPALMLRFRYASTTYGAILKLDDITLTGVVPTNRTVTVTKSGTGTGTVTSAAFPSVNTINCGATCSGLFKEGTAVTLSAFPSGDWNQLNPMGVYRTAQNTTTLLATGKVLVTGGNATPGGADYLASTELFDPATGLWTNDTPMKEPRSYHSAVLLASGKVLVAGGANTTVVIMTSELYDPVTHSWTYTTGSLARERMNHTATLLNNGKVLVVGGQNATGLIAEAELYDPATDTWGPAGTLKDARYVHTATLLPNGKVLVTGGETFGTPQYLKSAELYDPATNSWTSAAPMAIERVNHTATLLGNGKVLIAGGISLAPVPNQRPQAAELYDPATDTWGGAGILGTAREWHTATLLPTGQVLVVGGQGNLGVTTSSELYNPVSNSWSTASPTKISHVIHAAVALPGNRVLVTGGIPSCGRGICIYNSEMYSPGNGSVFAGWSGGGCSGPGPCQLFISDDVTVDALFTRPMMSEVFNTTAVGALPAGWQSTAVTGTLGAWQVIDTSSHPVGIILPASRTRVVRFNGFDAGGQTAQLASPPFSLTNVSTAKVSFWFYRDSENPAINDGMQVFINSTLLGEVRRSIYHYPAVTTAGWHQYQFDIPAGLTGPTNNLIFRAVADTGGGFGNDLHLDDILMSGILMAPNPPTNVVATAGNGQAQVSFTAPLVTGGSPITSYTVTARPGGRTATGPTSPLNVTGLTNGTSYTFTVTASNNIGISAPSAPSNSVKPATFAVAPQTVVATAGNGVALVTFDPPLDLGGGTALGYSVTSNPAGGVDTAADTLATTHMVTGLVNGLAYTFTVAATTEVGIGAASTPSNSVTPTAAPLPFPPTGVTALPGDISAQVSFTPPVSNNGAPVTSYTAIASPGGQSASGTGSPLSVTGLANGITCTFTVTATSLDGTSPPSIPSPGITPATVPGAPTGVTATASDGFALVNFTPPASNGGIPITGYTVTSSPEGLSATSLDIPAHLLGLTNGTTYTFTVTAVNAAGSGPPSAQSNIVTPVGTPNPPQNVSALPGDGSALVTFSAPVVNGGSPITGYTVTSIPAGGVDTNTGVPTNHHLVTGLANGTPYSFTVTATSAAGTSLPSDPSNVVIPEVTPVTPTYARIGTTGYPTLSDAYGAAVATDTILASQRVFVEDLTLNLGKAVTVIGGFDQDFALTTGLPTLLNGVLTITSGRLTAQGLAVW